jgi:transposase
MAKPILPDDLWAIIEPLLPAEPLKPKGGRPRVPDRAALTGIIFVLRTGIPWEYLPQELGCGSGMTCWRRLRDWQEVGVWERLHRTLLDRLGEAGQIDWERASLDTTHVPAKKGGRLPAPTRPIAANRARSSILWSTAGGRRSPSA